MGVEGLLIVLIVKNILFVIYGWLFCCDKMEFVLWRVACGCLEPGWL